MPAAHVSVAASPPIRMNSASAGSSSLLAGPTREHDPLEPALAAGAHDPRVGADGDRRVGRSGRRGTATSAPRSSRRARAASPTARSGRQVHRRLACRVGSADDEDVVVAMVVHVARRRRRSRRRRRGSRPRPPHPAGGSAKPVAPIAARTRTTEPLTSANMISPFSPLPPPAMSEPITISAPKRTACSCAASARSDR